MNWTDALLSLVVQYTPIVVPTTMFFGGVGIPFPNSMITVVLGTLVQQKLLQPISLTWLVVIPTVLGDVVCFLLARAAINSQKFRTLTKYLRLSATTTEQTRATRFFSKYGYLSILLSRFAVTPLAIPMTILAANANYPLRKFMLVDLLGEIIWACLYTSLGYYFGLYWQTIYQLINNLVSLLSMLTVISILIAIQTKRTMTAKKKVLKNNKSEMLHVG